jgi:hypothetical protein
MKVSSFVSTATISAGEIRTPALSALNIMNLWIIANKCYNLFKMSLASLIRTIHRTHLCGRLKILPAASKLLGANDGFIRILV